MSEITEGYYCFLCNIGVPYGGYVKGHGKACSLPITTYSSKPISGSIGGGKTYVSHNYVSTIIPEDTQSTSSDAELEKIMKDYLLRRGIYDKNSPNEPIKIKNPAYLQIKVHGDSTTVIYNLPPHNINEKSRTSDLLGAMQYAESGGAGYQGGSVVLTNANNRELPIQLQPNTNNIEAARTLRKASSLAFTLEQTITPAVMSMESQIRQSLIRNSKQLSKYPVWLEKKIPMVGKLDSRTIFPQLKIPGIRYVNPQTLRTTAKVLKYGGNALGGLGLGFTILDISENGLNRNNGTHFAMSVLAIIPYTRVVASGYFISNMIVSFFTDKNIEDYVDDYIVDPVDNYMNQVIGKSMMKQIENSPPAGIYMWNNEGLYRY